MGKLIRLELFNFKSYKGHHVMLFGNSYFTSIIGPNGSGKSNSMDAISFVLGIKSSHLRSSHLRDLVYRGRVLAQAEIGADGGVAENGQTQDAEAHGTQDDDDMDEDGANGTQTNGKRADPTTAWVMAVYEDDAGDEQAWKRSITASGTSEYRINNRVVTAKDYNDALEAEQILIKARNFLVFQGDVEAIASQSSKGLTRLIEQISGSLEYKADYDRLSDESERAIDIHNAKLKHRRTLNAEAKQYQEQKDEADKYIALQKDYDQAVVDHVLWKLYHLQKTIDDSAEAIQRHQDELKELLRNSAADEKRTEALKKEQASASRQLNKADDTVKKHLKAIENKENDLLPVDEKLDLSNKKIRSVTKRVEDIEKERKSQQQAVDKLIKDLANVNKAQTQWEAEYKKAQKQSGRDLSPADLQEYDRIRSEVSKQTVTQQGQIDALSRRLQSDQEMVASLKGQTVSGQSQVSRIEAEVAALESRAQELTENIDSLTEEIDKKRTAFNSLQSQRVKATQRRAELEEKLQEVLKTIAAARANRQETEKEARFRDTVSTLKRLFPGVLGPLSTLVKPKQKKFAVAVATALGRNSDAIVVETEKIANNCIQHLKNQRTSRETFIPLDTVVHKSPDSNLRGMHPGMRLVMDTIEFDSSIERAVAYAVADTVVCESTQIARHLCYDRKIDAKAVTLEGTVISKGGNMTGGQGPDQRNAQVFQESHIENAHRIKDKLLADISELPKVHQSQDQEETLQAELNGLEARLSYARDESKALSRNIDDKNQELDNAQNLLDEAQRKYDQHAPGLTSLQQQLDQATSGISRVEDQLFSAFCKRLGYKDIRVYETQQGSMQRDATNKKLEFANQKSKIENQKTFEQQRLTATKNRIKKLEDEAQAARVIVEDCMREKETLNEELDELRGELDGLQEQFDQLKATHSEKGEQLAQHRREVKKREGVIENTTKASDSLQQEVATADLGRLNLLKQCRMKAIDIPLKPGSRKLDALPQADEDEDPDAMDVDTTDLDPTAGVNDHGILVDYDDLDDEFKDNDSSEHEKELLKAIDDLNKELESKAPNSRAIERLDNIKRRVKDQEAEFLAAQKEMNSKKKEFEDVRDKRLELFTRAYEHISNRIDTVYKDLTRTESFQLGGSASLTLEGDEDAPFLSGIKYHAMPPLKRFRDMEHLSGGEKTMAALALLFAIHNYIPSPFFVLDEVDAALDNANTAQLADYLRSHARPGMQFVVISLKATLFQNSETLVGIMRDQALNSSRALTLDLRKYRD